MGPSTLSARSGALPVDSAVHDVWTVRGEPVERLSTRLWTRLWITRETAADLHELDPPGVEERNSLAFRAMPSRPSHEPRPGAVEIRRSARRRRTVSAYRDGDRTVVLVPSRLSRAEEERLVADMLERLARQDARRRPSDTVLMARATALSDRHLDGRARPRSVRWATNQGSRWGSCTPADGSIRLSSRLQGLPQWVSDYVLVHELCHLLVPGHGPDFWALVAGYPKAERARGYLEGVSAASGLALSDD